MANLEDTSFGTEASGFKESKASAFSTTHWSVVLGVRRENLTEAADALERLCQTYRYPVYVFIRRRGSGQHDAEDLTQGFFAQLLEKETLKKVDRQKGKFRAFILAALTNFLNNEWDKRQALKRGGKIQMVSLDETRAEEIYLHEPADALTPEKLFERRWARRWWTGCWPGSNRNTPRRTNQNSLKNLNPVLPAKSNRMPSLNGPGRWR